MLALDAEAFCSPTPSVYTEMIALHTTATVELCHHVIPSMRQNQRGFIINVGSSIGEFSVPGSALYCATKPSLIISQNLYAWKNEQMA